MNLLGTCNTEQIVFIVTHPHTDTPTPTHPHPHTTPSPMHRSLPPTITCMHPLFCTYFVLACVLACVLAFVPTFVLVRVIACIYTRDINFTF